MTDDLKDTTTTEAVAEDWAKVKLPPRVTGLPMAVWITENASTGSLDRGQRKAAIFNDLKSAGPEAPWSGKWPTNQLPQTGLSIGVPCCGPERRWPRPGQHCYSARMPKRSHDPEEHPR